MDGFIEANLKPITLQRLNFCRLWLQVTFVSDISMLQGNTIDRQAWLGVAPMPSSKADWPQQSRPEEKVWRLWRYAVSKSICIHEGKNVMANKPGILAKGLGSWLPDSAPKQSPRWRTFLAHSSQRLYVPASGVPDHYDQLSTETRLDFSLAHYHLDESRQRIHVSKLPDDAVPVHPTHNGFSSRVNRTSTPSILANPPEPTITSFQEFLDSQPRWKTELLNGVFSVGQVDSLGAHLLQGLPLLMCSHGGATANTGSFGWVIA
jgi:hypothetical protein